MLAFRGVSARCRTRGLSFWTARVCCGTSNVWMCPENDTAESIENQGKPLNILCAAPANFYSSISSCLKSYGHARKFSVQTGAESGEEESDDLEDGFSELETPYGISEEFASDENHDNELPSKPVIVEEDDLCEEGNAMEVIVEENASGENKGQKMSKESKIAKVIFTAPSSSSVSTVMDKWVEEGNQVTPTEVSSAMLTFRRKKLYLRALQLSEWLESRKPYELSEKFYSSHVDLLAKVRGIHLAEEYLKHIPKPFKDDVVHRSLLANCVVVGDAKRAEKIFNIMKESNFSISCFSCNQMLLLYKRTYKKKIADILVFMEAEKIQPTFFTYYTLVDVKGQAKDIEGMERIVETMKAEGLETTPELKGLLARHYAAMGVKDKAEALLKELEDTKTRSYCHLLLQAYGLLGRDDEVDRIWKLCQPNPFLIECMVAIEAWGRLKKVENAEAVFEKVLKKVKKPSSKQISSMLGVYADNKMLSKGKDLMKRMADLGCNIGPLVWDSLVRLYISAGEIEKADSIIGKVLKQKQGRPMFQSLILIMEKYAARGDIHNAEKILLMMKDVGYFIGVRHYRTLLKAYENAKTPAYGIVDRMKADGVFLNQDLANLLARVDSFKKSAVYDLLE